MGVKLTPVHSISGICVCGKKLSKPKYCVFTYEFYMKCKNCGRTFKKIIN